MTDTPSAWRERVAVVYLAKAAAQYELLDPD